MSEPGKQCNKIAGVELPRPERLAGTIQDMGLNPGQIMMEFKAELENAGMKGMDLRHIFANIMGMVIFPYIGRPLFQMIAFQGDTEAYEEFLSERIKLIPNFMRMAFLGAGLQKQKS